MKTLRRKLQVLTLHPHIMSKRGLCRQSQVWSQFLILFPCIFFENYFEYSGRIEKWKMWLLLNQQWNVLLNSPWKFFVLVTTLDHLKSDSLFSLIILIYVSVIFVFMFFSFCWKEPEPPPPDPAHKNIPMITSILEEMEKQVGLNVWGLPVFAHLTLSKL